MLRALERETAVDFVELSGGTYENPVFIAETPPAAATTQGRRGCCWLLCPLNRTHRPSFHPAREGFFLTFAALAKQTVSLPLVVTGGYACHRWWVFGWRPVELYFPARFRSLAGINRALTTGAADLVGMARPLIMDPALAGKWLRGTSAATPPYTLVGLCLVHRAACPPVIFHCAIYRLQSVGFFDKLLVPGLNNLWYRAQQTGGGGGFCG